MSKDKDKAKNLIDPEDIDIDYENIDVKDIMDQIKRLIAARAKASESESEQEDQTPPFVSSAEENAEKNHQLPSSSRMKSLLLKLMKPFSPLIKLLVLPVYQEFRETVLILDDTNKRLDQLGQSLDEVNRHSLATSQRIDEDLPFLKEYTRLLYNLAHNTVVEMTKLKIEEENIKLRIRILEKDFENLKSRERALESRMMP